ncbi:hypothetical protein [Peribacillus muralis]|nr:hypothetical protein [Peribacillus muralis]
MMIKVNYSVPKSKQFEVHDDDCNEENPSGMARDWVCNHLW